MKYIFLKNFKDIINKLAPCYFTRHQLLFFLLMRHWRNIQCHNKENRISLEEHCMSLEKFSMSLEKYLISLKKYSSHYEGTFNVIGIVDWKEHGMTLEKNWMLLELLDAIGRNVGCYWRNMGFHLRHIECHWKEYRISLENIGHHWRHLIQYWMP